MNRAACMDLLAFARAKVPFYRATEGDWRSVPVVGRNDYVDRICDFLAGIDGADDAYTLRSSGTTGPALVVALDRDAWSVVNFGFFEQVRAMSGLGATHFARGRPGVLFVSNKPGRTSFVRPLPSLADSLYVRMQLPEDAGVARRAYMRMRAPILYGKPTYLLELRSALMAAGDAFAPWSPALLVTSGESLYDDDRARLETFFCAPLLDALASTEGGLIAVKAAGDDVYRVIGENVRLEVIDRDGAVREEGEGELVVTNLVYRRTVFLRYRTGDTAVLRTEADSGQQSLPSLRGREPVTLSFGAYCLRTDAVARAFDGLPGLGDYRLTAAADGAASLQWLPEPNRAIDSDAITSALRRHFEAWLPGRSVAIEPVDMLTAKGGKKRRFVQVQVQG